MALTLAQKTVLKAAIAGNPTWAAFSNDSDGNFNLAQVLNQTAVPAFKVWATAVATDRLLDQVDGTKYTPAAIITGTEVEPLLSRKRGWLDEINVKLMMLQTLIGFRPSFNAALALNRGNLRDAVTQIPSGALDGNGKPGLTSAGGTSGANVLNVCLRDATEGEKILTTGSQTTGTVTADVMGFEGSLPPQDIQEARSI